MQALRNSRRLAAFVLVWFGLFIGSAIAAPIVKPGSLQMVCAAGGGMKLVDTGSPDGEAKASSSMDCPLCATVAPPTIAALGTQRFEVSPCHTAGTAFEAHVPGASAPPLPSRGPPSELL